MTADFAEPGWGQDRTKLEAIIVHDSAVKIQQVKWYGVEDLSYDSVQKQPIQMGMSSSSS